MRDVVNGHGDLLEDALFSVREQGGDVVVLNLPEVLHLLWCEEVLSFEALQAHQRQAWHCFLVQLAALCFCRGGLDEEREDASAWRAALLTLCDGIEEAFRLVVEDVSLPAFMQSPIPEGSLAAAKYKEPHRTPDDLDMLVTSKNHDVKMARVDHARLEHWVFALVTLQTMEGFLGRGNYGIARMNGGFGSRPLLSYVPAATTSARFRHDVQVLRSSRDESLQGALPYLGDGLALCWLKSWDGGKNSGLALEALDPFFIEICRRLRFAWCGEHLECWRANTQGARLDTPKDLNGLTGDPWTPVLIDKDLPVKALTLSGSGFNYKIVHGILFSGDYVRPPSMRTPVDGDDMVFVAECLVRGQGKTEGLHRRELRVPNNVKRRLLGAPSEHKRLALISMSRVEAAETMRRSVLYPALGRLSTEGDNVKPDAGKLARWTQAFEDCVDACFFPELWAAFELDEREAKKKWGGVLEGFAREQLEDAIGSMPISTSGYWRAVSSAESMFRSCLRKHFGESEEA